MAAADVGQELADEVGGTWISRLQAIVDEASRVLGRPVAIDDRHMRLLAYTQHREDDVDRVRLLSIMKQPFPAEVVAWMDRHGAWTSDRPFRVPHNHALELDARVGAPIMCQGHRLGMVWCTDRDRSMTDEDLERIGAFADEAAVVLYREMLLHDLDRSRERELLRDILSADESIRRDAAWRLAELDLFTPDGRVVVLVIPLDHLDDRVSETTRVGLEGVLMRIRRHLTPRHGLHMVRPDHALILASLADPAIRSLGLPAFASRIHDEIVTSLPGDRSKPRQVVAVGGVALELAAAADSYEQALRAAKVGTTISAFGDVIAWDELGIYQMLTELPLDQLRSKVVHQSLHRLLDDPRASDLLPTLERYLDFAGDVQETAASLYLHRTTLYHRLRKIETVANVDLRSGDDRLALHLSLKLARLQGITWPEPARDTDAGDARE